MQGAFIAQPPARPGWHGASGSGTRSPSRRYLAGSAAATALAAAAFIAWRRAQPRRALTLADALTLSRVGAAALLAGQAADGRASAGAGSWGAWGAVVAAATLSDWLDGPLARRLGGMGEAFDLEADSWLTLCAALAAIRQGRLPSVALLAPAARYALPIVAWRLGRYRRLSAGREWWARAAGSAQMALLLAALAPTIPPAIRRRLRQLAWPLAAAQLATLAVLLLRLLRDGPAAVGAPTAAA